MKRLLALLLAVLMMTCCLFAVACKTPEDPDKQPPDDPEEGEPNTTEPRAFLAGYERLIPQGDTTVSLSGRVLLNMNADGTLDVYIGFLNAGAHQTAHYTGTYSFGVNEENDETVTFSYTHNGTTETVTDAVIIDGVFATPFYMVTEMTSSDVKFYETSPLALEGDVYVGYLAKVSGMGNMVYAYALSLKADGKFTVSIMQMAATMHIVGLTEGTYTIDGESIAFHYDVSDGEGGVAKEDFVSNGTDYSATGLSGGFNIAQASVTASAASFIKIK